MAPLIEAVDVGKRFKSGLGRQSTLALDGLSLAIDAEAPSVVAVVGESGSGKTTLARLLLGLAEPTTGEVRYRGEDIRRLGRNSWRAFRRDVQAVFQDPYGVYNRPEVVELEHELPLSADSGHPPNGSAGGLSRPLYGHSLLVANIG